jgi:hypothetical protein
MATTFLPEGHEHMKTEKKYWKLSQMKEGENRLRVVQRPIAGWIDWHENKPVRYRPDQRPRQPFDPEKPIKAFWNLYVWDYERKDLFILEVNQGSVIKGLTAIATDEDWGDMTQFDIKIKKEGSGKETRYSIQPIPHKPMSDEIKAALKASPVRLEALYEGGDPWRDLEPVHEAANGLSGDFNSLAKLLVDHIELPEKEMVPHYLEFCAPKLPKPIAEAVEIWLSKPAEFAKAYMKWLGGDTARQIKEKLAS